MAVDIETLVEAYQIMREHTPQKERQSAADALMSTMIDVLDELELPLLVGADSYMKRAYEEYNDSTDDDIEYDYED